MNPSRHHSLAVSFGSALLVLVAFGQEPAEDLAGRVAFADLRNPPPWTPVHEAAQRDFNLGRTIFNTQWVPTGSEDPSPYQGLGPLFIETSCAGCHEHGARGRPAAPGELSHSFVMQLGGTATAYGHVLNTRAIAGHSPEGRITVTLHSRELRLADGSRRTLREPRYAIEDEAYGPLPAGTVLKPRIAPAVFGAGLLDAVPQTALEAIRQAQPESLRGTAGGRFGWQGDAASLVDQTAIAFAREMGLTSSLMPQDDCTALQLACRQAAADAAPEVPERLFHAVNSYQFLVSAPARIRIAPAVDAAGSALFEQVGCAACHVPQLPVPRAGAADIRIDPYTDLLLHDLGDALADRNIDGRPVTSRWRTAPLWGLAHALQAGPVALLHDGRAASIEEAILWHEGQADDSRRRFMALDGAQRQQLLAWLATL